MNLQRDFDRARQTQPAPRSSRQHMLLLGAADAPFNPMTFVLIQQRPFYSRYLNSQACFYIAEMFSG